MGTHSSKLVKKMFGSNNKDTRPKHTPKINKPSTRRKPYTSPRFDEIDVSTKNLIAQLPRHIGPLVLYREGSMYFDEDGDLAHEFYAEVKENGIIKMKRVYDNLRPQGLVKLPIPRLQHDCPVVLYML